ncbi:hypothetical protein BC833DRAFT_605148, partial [Globomyces pollinis-pini]
MWFFGSNEFQYESLPDLKDKVILITGGTAGLGKQSAIELLKKNATIIITARNEEKGKLAVADILEKTNNQNPNISFGVMDQGDLTSVRAFADWFLKLNVPLNVLMLNAGIAVVPFKMIDGLESHFYVNHMSHFLLVKLLLEKIKQTPASRVVFVSSDAHQIVRETPDWEVYSKYNYEDSMTGSFHQYGISKLANIQTALVLTRRLADENVYV